jgi:hypothetical protein
MRYFAYGSNMSFARLTRRVPSAVRIGACTLRQHDLRFHKKGTDGSGKCDAFHTDDPNHFIVGSLYDINRDEKRSLDLVEGLGVGYAEKRVSLITESGETIEALTYYATMIDGSLRPYSWYLQHVLIGAVESGCPPDYVARISGIQAIEDTHRQRDARERAVHD